MLSMLILMMGIAPATVEDLSNSADTGSILPTTPSLPSIPISTPNLCASVSYLIVNVDLTGPQSEADRGYTTQGKGLDFVVTVKNEGSTDADTELSIDPEGCDLGWFSWTTTSMNIPPGASRSKKFLKAKTRYERCGW